MVGDGPNYGIALKVADIGISYQQNSSPIARGLSKILINDLTDLLTLIASSSRLDKQTRDLGLLRDVVIVVSLFSIYAWIYFSC